MTLMLLSCTSHSQNLNKEILVDGGKPYLVGKINKEGLSAQNYSSWFTVGYDEYEPNEEIIKEISNQLKNYDILLFMGTWCGDSRREVPRFFKVLESVKYPMNHLTTVGVSRTPELYKQSPTHEEKGLNIHRVPTFIFYKNGQEVNRIVEHPVKTLEEDILDILKGDYRSNYYLVTKVNELIDNDNFYELSYQNLDEYKDLATSMYELNTYARLLSSTGKSEKALKVLRLNSELFSNDFRVFISLANAYYQLNEKKLALTQYEKAIVLNPGNQKLKTTIEKVKSEI